MSLMKPARRYWLGKSIIGALILLALVFMVGWLQMEGNGKRVRVTMNDSGTSVTLHQGEVLEVVLPATFGTGYSWKVANAAANVLKLRGEPKIETDPNGSKVGQTENQVFLFGTSGKGSGQVELEYLRPWEKDRKPAKTFSLTVKVE